MALKRITIKELRVFFKKNKMYFPKDFERHWSVYRYFNQKGTCIEGFMLSDYQISLMQRNYSMIKIKESEDLLLWFVFNKED